MVYWSDVVGIYRSIAQSHDLFKCSLMFAVRRVVQACPSWVCRSGCSVASVERLRPNRSPHLAIVWPSSSTRTTRSRAEASWRTSLLVCFTLTCCFPSCFFYLYFYFFCFLLLLSFFPSFFFSSTCLNAYLLFDYISYFLLLYSSIAKLY